MRGTSLWGPALTYHNPFRLIINVYMVLSGLLIDTLMVTAVLPHSRSELLEGD